MIAHNHPNKHYCEEYTQIDGLHGATVENRCGSKWHDTYTPHHVSVQFACPIADVNTLWCASNAHRQNVNRMHIQNMRIVNRPLVATTFTNTFGKPSLADFKCRHEPDNHINQFAEGKTWRLSFQKFKWFPDIQNFTLFTLPTLESEPWRWSLTANDKGSNGGYPLLANYHPSHILQTPLPLLY